MVSAVVKAVVLISFLSVSCVCKMTDTEKEKNTHLSSLKREIRTVEVETKSLMIKFEGVQESFQTVETKMTVLNTQVSGLEKNMKAVERAALVLEINVTQIYEEIRKGQEKTENLKALSADMRESLKQLQNATDTLTFKITQMEKAFINEKEQLHGLVADLKSRLLEMEKKQEKNTVSLGAVWTVVNQMTGRPGYTKDVFELPETADYMQNDESKTDEKIINAVDFSWEEFLHKLLKGNEPQILLWSLLALVFYLHIPYGVQAAMEKYKWINPIQALDEESNIHLSMNDIAKSTSENHRDINKVLPVLTGINNLRERLGESTGKLEKQIQKLQKDIETETKERTTLAGNLKDHNKSLSRTVDEHKNNFESINENLKVQKACSETLRNQINDQGKVVQENRQTSEGHRNELHQTSADIASLKTNLENVEAIQKSFVAEDAFKKSQTNINRQIQTQAGSIRKLVKEDTDRVIKHLTDVIKRTSGQHQQGLTAAAMPVLVAKLSKALEKYTQSSSSESEDKKAAKALIADANAALDRCTLSSGSGSGSELLSDIDSNMYPLPRPNVPLDVHVGQHSSGRRGTSGFQDSGFRGVTVYEDEDDNPMTCEEDLE